MFTEEGGDGGGSAWKHSSGDLQSRLKTRKILGVGETEGGDVHRSKISQVLGHNEHLYVRFPRGCHWVHVSVTALMCLEGGLFLLWPAWAVALGLMARGTMTVSGTEPDSGPEQCGAEEPIVTACLRPGGAALCAFTSMLWWHCGEQSKSSVRFALTAAAGYHAAVGLYSLWGGWGAGGCGSWETAVVVVRAVICCVCGGYVRSIGEPGAGYHNFARPAPPRQRKVLITQRSSFELYKPTSFHSFTKTEQIKSAACTKPVKTGATLEEVVEGKKLESEVNDSFTHSGTSDKPVSSSEPGASDNLGKLPNSSVSNLDDESNDAGACKKTEQSISSGLSQVKEGSIDSEDIENHLESTICEEPPEKQKEDDSGNKTVEEEKSEDPSNTTLTESPQNKMLTSSETEDSYHTVTPQILPIAIATTRRRGESMLTSTGNSIKQLAQKEDEKKVN